MLSITSVMVLPAYFTSCAYLWKICTDGEYQSANIGIRRSTALLTGILGSVYALWLIYAAGLQYLMMAVVILALGIPVFWWARKQHHPDEPVFQGKEIWLAAILVIISLWAIYAFAHGLIKM